MNTGDRIKIIESLNNARGLSEKTKQTIGEILSINDYTITIIKIVKDKKTFKESYTLADLICKENRIYISKDGKWQRIKLKISSKKQ